MQQEPKIAVVGLGGVGGYLAGMLSKTYKDVTVVARGNRYTAIQERGIVVESEFSGNFTAKPARVVRDAEELEPVDYLFISVKNYSLEALLPSLSNAVGDSTVIIPVMNGVDPCDRVRAGVKGGTVVKALIYIVSFAREDYSIKQKGNYARVVFGLEDPDEREREILQRLDNLLEGANIQHVLSDNIILDIWKKFVVNCSFNVSTAYYDSLIGGIREDQERAKNYEALTMEAYAVARKRGVPMKREDAEAIVQRLYKSYADDASSSLQRDMHAGRPCEVETFSGYIVREGKRLGVPVPVSEMMYEGLKARASV